MNAMRNASDVTLNTIPKLDDLSLPFAFKNVKALEMENASLLENNGELMKWRMQTWYCFPAIPLSNAGFTRKS